MRLLSAGLKRKLPVTLSLRRMPASSRTLLNSRSIMYKKPVLDASGLRFSQMRKDEDTVMPCQNM